MNEFQNAFPLKYVRKKEKEKVASERVEFNTTDEEKNERSSDKRLCIRAAH